jgi:hypothetical protein
LITITITCLLPNFLDKKHLTTKSSQIADRFAEESDEFPHFTSANQSPDVETQKKQHE